MSSAIHLTSNKIRPYSADVSNLAKSSSRLQSSNCPTILKHDTQNLTLNPRPFTSTTDILNRPISASNATKMKFASLNQMRALSGASTARGQPSALNSVVSMDFLISISQGAHPKFQDKSKIKPLRKIKTEDFHSIIYKVKSQKEDLEKEINQMEVWQREVKENYIWNTPQATIVDSILKFNAQANPQGNISRLLNTEREQKDRESMLRASRRSNSRPQSSFFSKTPNRTLAKNFSVQDFFRADEEENAADENLLQGIIGTKKQYHSQYDANKQTITEKINRYMDNMENYSSQIDSNRGIITSRPMSAFIPTSHPITPILHNFPPQPPIQEDVPDIRNESSEVLMQEDEGSEFESFNAAAAMNQASNSRHPRMIGIRHSYERYQLDGTSSRLSPQSGFGGPIAIPGKPAAIHKRPHTARTGKVTATTLASGLVASGEPKQESVPKNIKILPFVMEGQRMQIEHHQNSLTMSSRSTIANDRCMDMPLMTPKLSKSTKNLKTSVKRPLTAGVSSGNGNGSQLTRVFRVNSRTNKINIDGGDLQNFASKQALDKSSRNNHLNSWATKASISNHGSRLASPRDKK